MFWSELFDNRGVGSACCRSRRNGSSRRDDPASCYLNLIKVVPEEGAQKGALFASVQRFHPTVLAKANGPSPQGSRPKRLPPSDLNNAHPGRPLEGPIPECDFEISGLVLDQYRDSGSVLCHIKIHDLLHLFEWEESYLIGRWGDLNFFEIEITGKGRAEAGGQKDGNAEKEEDS